LYIQNSDQNYQFGLFGVKVGVAIGQLFHFHTGGWRTGMSTLPAAPPINNLLGYRSRTRTLNPNLKP